MIAIDDTDANAAPGRIATPDGSLAVIACGPGWLVVEKPAGMSVHNDPGKDLCSWVAQALAKGALPAMGGRPAAVHAVHRLDRDTSGIVLLAADAARLAFFGEQFARRRVDKRYLALVHGHPATTDEKWMSWEWPLGKAAGGRRDPQGRGSRQASTTGWRILDQSVHYSLLECRLLTGRKHQIRRHALLGGHPIVGDRRYGSKRSLAYLANRQQFTRLGLHAHALALTLPDTTDPVRFTSAGLPQAMQTLLDGDR